MGLSSQSSWQPWLRPGSSPADVWLPAVENATRALGHGGSSAQVESNLAQIEASLPSDPGRGTTERQQAQVYGWDHFRCRYCGSKTIFGPVLELLSLAFPKLIPH